MFLSETDQLLIRSYQKLFIRSFSSEAIKSFLLEVFFLQKHLRASHQKLFIRSYQKLLISSNLQLISFSPETDKLLLRSCHVSSQKLSIFLEAIKFLRSCQVSHEKLTSMLSEAGKHIFRK